MKYIFPFLLGLFGTILASDDYLNAQEPITWLSDYTGDIVISSTTYKYSFLSIDGNPCKIRIVEKKVDKKGVEVEKAYLFYLSDVDPASLKFKTSGSSVLVTMGISNSQKFITELENGEIDGYVSSVTLTMNDIEKTRSFIDAIKEHSKTCMSSQRSWNSTQEAMNWLSSNIGPSSAGGTTYEQKFSSGTKGYLVSFVSKSAGAESTYDYNLSDINAQKINLAVSGKLLKIEVPARESKYYIRKKSGDQYSYVKELEIFSDDIEQARSIVNGLSYLASETKIPERKSWTSYDDALTFLQNNTGKVKVGSSVLEQSFSFEKSSEGKVFLSVQKTDSKGAVTASAYVFYLNDCKPEIALETASGNISMNLTINDKNKYIRVYTGDAIQSHASSLDLYADDLEILREMIHALEYAVKNSKSGVQSYASVNAAASWLSANVKDAETQKQSLSVSTTEENKIILEVQKTASEGGTVKQVFEVYPEDIDPGDLKIEVNGKKLSVPLSTGKFKYIKVITDDKLQNYISGEDVLFDDIKTAKNFIAAMKVIHEKSVVKNRSFSGQAEAWAYIKNQVGRIEIDGSVTDQSVDNPEKPCNVLITCTVTDAKGASTEYKYEFALSDIEPGTLKIIISGKRVQVELATKAKEKLIKPYKNGTAESFTYEAKVEVDDVLTARKVVGALETLVKGCK